VFVGDTDARDLAAVSLSIDVRPLIDERSCQTSGIRAITQVSVSRRKLSEALVEEVDVSEKGLVFVDHVIRV
jgi:hypothetical protein